MGDAQMSSGSEFQTVPIGLWFLMRVLPADMPQYHVGVQKQMFHYTGHMTVKNLYQNPVEIQI